MLEIAGLNRKACFSIVLLLTAFGCEAFATERLTSARTLVVPQVARPGYLEPIRDPTFGTSVTRVTDPGRLLAPGIRCSPTYCRHRYSSEQTWNADQSLLVLTNGCNGLCFLDGHTYKPAFYRPVHQDDCKWHPVDPTLMICVDTNHIYTWAPRTDIRTVVFAPNHYRELQFGPYKGNPSADGKRLVIRATDLTGKLVAFAYDISARRKYPDIDLARLEGSNGYCGISPSGRYILCLNTRSDKTEVAYVFTVDGVELQHWTEHHRPGHGDMTIDVDGNDVYVGISKANPDKWHIIKRRLVDGYVTDLTPPGYATHASIRNVNRAGWVFLSYEGSYSKVISSPGWTPFYQEVVALRIDGSGEVRRIAHTHNVKNDYYSETHASPSPDGSQVIWSSNWGERGGSVADYVSRVTWPSAASH
jgi:hypothetical protein